MVNQDNTCFLNATLQCLIHTPPLAEVLLVDKPWGGQPPSSMLLATQKVARGVLRSKAAVNPVAHIRELRKLLPRCGRRLPAGRWLAVDDDT